jgi:Zn-dependent metalloprotease
MDQSLHQHRVCSIVPPYVLRAIAAGGGASAARTLAHDAAVRTLRAVRAPGAGVASIARGTSGPHKERTVSDARGTMRLPGVVVREEGDGPTGDDAVDEAYDSTGATFDVFWEQFDRDSIDGAGLPLRSTVHYGRNYLNAFWDGSRMIFGDGDGEVFNRFTIAVDVIAHELTHGVTDHLAALEYQGQSGALNESVSDVFGSLVKQHELDQTAAEADWLIGAGLLAAGVDGVALRSMRAPGTAYDDPLLGGKDPQPATMDDFVDTDEDDGGVHINSGIPNRAFYLAATAFREPAWERAGHIWYATLADPRLSSTATFAAFAARTVANAAAVFDAAAASIVRDAWDEVGIQVR